jgi:hypothetical protein
LEEFMAEEQNQGTQDIGMFARHPLRTMGGAFLAGAAIGMGTAGKRRHNRSALRRMLDG